VQALPIATYPAIPNEPVFSNTAGTIAMAKVDGDPNSATSQWFFNVGDNSANLDFQNGGFTVFGSVLGDGMNVINALSALPTVNLSASLGPYGGPFNAMPYYTVEGQEGSYALVVQDIAVVPEPSALALAALGIAAVCIRRRR
jgi:peptidyl-prolyl cis-trans isomerase A (cyclophilin A)